MKLNPIFSRQNTEELKDGWLFSFDERTWQAICVPFCPESVLSGIGYTGFIRQCFYKKNFAVQDIGERVVLHFGAVDYRTVLYVNGKYVGMHVGGFTPFAFDITNFLNTSGENELSLTVYDDEYSHAATGKQSYKEQSFGCFYTRTTGIWQPVWLEYVPENHVKQALCYPDIHAVGVNVDLSVVHEGKYKIEVFLEGKPVGETEGEIAYRKNIFIPLSEKRLWSLGEGNLYDVKITYGQDEVETYFGLREIRYDGYQFLLNDKETYQKLVLDQGYYPDGIYTAPSVEAMQKDIDLGLRLGFNGARLHQKVFDPRFLYLCDKAGYMVWGEFPSWGVDYSNTKCLGQFLSEWEEAVMRDFNHPAIITWCPLNEVWGASDDKRKKRDVKCVDAIYAFTKTLDSTRPVVDASGGHHGKTTDLFDFHCYKPVSMLKEYLDRIQKEDIVDIPLLDCAGERSAYRKGMPLNISECGGISFGVAGTDAETETVNEAAVQKEKAWGYGKGERDGNAFVERYKELIELIYSYDKLSGFCYTQLYDIEQEQNGFYYYDRTDKLTEEQKDAIRTINNQKGCF